MSAFFTFQASRSRRICFVAAHSQWTTTAGVRLYPHDEKRRWVLPLNISSRQSLTPNALYLQQPRPVNNPGKSIRGEQIRGALNVSAGGTEVSVSG